MATALEIAQAVARRVRVPVPDALIGNDDATAALLLGALLDACEEIAREHDWICLQREHTFSTSDAIDAYSLPSDFARPIGDTIWNRSTYLNMRGGLSPQEWQWRRSSIAVTGPYDKGFRFKVDGITNKLSLDPVPTGAENLVFEYASKNWCRSSGGTAQSTLAADTDVLLLDELTVRLYMLYLALTSLGLPSAVEFARYQDVLSKNKQRERSPPVLHADDCARHDGPSGEVNILNPSWGVGDGAWGD